METKIRLGWRTYTRLKTLMEWLESNFTWIIINWNSKAVCLIIFPKKSALGLHVFADMGSCAYGAYSKAELNLNAVSWQIQNCINQRKFPYNIQKFDLQAAVSASRIKVKIMKGLKETATSAYIFLVQLKNCIKLFAQWLFKFWSICHSVSTEFLIVPI